MCENARLLWLIFEVLNFRVSNQDLENMIQILTVIKNEKESLVSFHKKSASPISIGIGIYGFGCESLK